MSISKQTFFKQDAYINGQWVAATDGSSVAVTDPASGETLGHVPSLSAEQVSQAIDAANAALPAWRAKTAAERSQLLKRWHALIMENEAALGELMTLEQGNSW